MHELVCPGRCSSHGTCDGEGFCRCDAGWWGLDCALTKDESGAAVLRPGGGVAIRPRHSPRHARPGWPRIYVYDLPPALRLGRTSFEANLDFDLTARLLRHPARAADPARADWLGGPVTFSS